MGASSTMVNNLRELMPSLTLALNAIVSLIAVALCGFAVMKFIAHAKQRGDGMVKPITPVLMLVSAAMLWNLSASASAFLQTVYGEDTTTQNLIGYTASSAMPEQSSAMLGAMIMFVRFIGYMFFASGWMNVTKIGSGTQSAEGAFSRSLWRIVGGVAAINIVGTVNLISGFLGFGDVL
ncbi:MULTISPECIES: type IV secretion protein IcmC [Xanthomonas]|uniref:Intracellular multiplication protein IcmC n=1 Tax=Xanthomonas arboricola TaxID=56448 RepID=A0AB73H365_9XANT|nr:MULTISPECIES: type IV secretion protein IcmC [Xanthomonas]MBB5672595.1 intracellular multiplication protein IcmC [Xanthomonas arboricola]OCG90325.1 hypothetical protein LMG667_02590 [Xanthomonas euvesicatoria]PNV26505.1 type IV secretion protein IcmC [Xanthomonas citri]